MTVHRVLGSLLDLNRTTLRMMGQLIDRWCAQPEMVNLARGILRDAGAQGDVAEATAVWAWVKENVIYRRDPASAEYLQDPVQTLLAQAGDCDDMATLAGTLLAAVGHEMTPRGVVWEGDSIPSHAVVWDATAGLTVDPVADVPPPAWPPAGYVPARTVEGWS